MNRAIRSLLVLPALLLLTASAAAAQEPCPDPAFAQNISWRPLANNIVQLVWSKSLPETSGSQTSFTIEVGSGPGLSDVAVIPPQSVVQTNTHASLALTAGVFYVRLIGGRPCSSVRLPSEEITVTAGQATGSSQIRVNEIGMRSGSSPASLEFIELKNFGSATANIGNWRIFSGSFNAASYAATVPTGVTIPAGCTYLLVRDGSGLAGDLAGNDLRGRSAAVVDSTGRIRDSVAAAEDNDGGQSYPLVEGNLLANQASGSFERTSTNDNNDNAVDYGHLTTATPQNSTQCGGTGNFPGAPASLAAFVSGSSVTLTWSPPATGLPLTHYVLELGTTPGGNQFAPLTLSAALTSITFLSAPNGTYYARLRAANASGLSSPSNEATIVVCTAGCTVPPGAPTNLAVSVNGSNVLLTWRRPTVGATPTGYVLEAGTASGLANLGTFPTGSTNDFALVTGVPPGTYFVRVRAIAGSTTGAGSNEVVVVVQ